jgi:hypothetical protein
MHTSKRILAALTGVEEDCEATWDMVGLTDPTYEPPTYAVFWALSLVAGMRPYRPGEKAVWEFYVRYKGRRFCLADWKGGSWSIRGMEETPAYRESAAELKGKIGAAARLAERGVEPLLKRQVEQGNFYVENSYHRVRPVYEHFRGELGRLEREREATIHSWRQAGPAPQTHGAQSSGGDAVRLSSELGKQLTWSLAHSRALSRVAAPMVVFYFSYTEIILDIMFALSERKSMSWHEFRSLHWDDRFKQTLQPSSDHELNTLYQRLLELKRTLRDPLVHGYGCEEALLVPMPHFGLIPVSYAPWAKRFHLPSSPVPDEMAAGARETFDLLDKWLESHEDPMYALLYARSGFPIPFGEAGLKEIRGWMSSPEEFEAGLQREAEIQDAMQY